MIYVEVVVMLFAIAAMIFAIQTALAARRWAIERFPCKVPGCTGKYSWHYRHKDAPENNR